MAPDPRLCAPVTPTPKQPDGASIVKPQTPEESRATGLLLGWVADLVDVAIENEGRAVLGRKGCPAP